MFPQKVCKGKDRPLQRLIGNTRNTLEYAQRHGIPVMPCVAPCIQTFQNQPKDNDTGQPHANDLCDDFRDLSHDLPIPRKVVFVDE